MPLSLWFVLKKGNPFEKTAQELISTTVPNLFLSPDQIQEFPPHVTIASGIELPADQTPQEWLDGLDVSAYRSQHNEVKLELDHVQAEDPFFRKLNIALKDDDNLRNFAASVRASAQVPEPEGGYRSHFSLLYADLPTKDVKAKLALIEMKIGFAIGDLFACCGGALCIGGSMVLVDTGKPIKEWKDSYVAERETPWTQWRMTRNLV